MSKTHYKALMNPDYIGAYWLVDGQDATVVIDSVSRERVIGNNGKSEECLVARLRSGVKPFIVNATNAKTIAKLYGKYIEDWVGKPITLFAGTTKFQGEVVECLRVREVVAKQAPRPINPARLDQAISAIAAGSYTAERLKASHTLTDAQNKQLEDALARMAAGPGEQPSHKPGTADA